jgi:hypothetical protein
VSGAAGNGGLPAQKHFARRARAARAQRDRTKEEAALLQAEIVLALTFYRARMRDVQEHLDALHQGPTAVGELSAPPAGSGEAPCRPAGPNTTHAGGAEEGHVMPAKLQPTGAAPTHQQLREGQAAILRRAHARFGLMLRLVEVKLSNDIAGLYTRHALC